MPLDVGRSKNGAFKYLKDKIWRRIQGWLEKLLSAGGKDILIKYVAQAIDLLHGMLSTTQRSVSPH
jgi:hypothetical protein